MHLSTFYISQTWKMNENEKVFSVELLCANLRISHIFDLCPFVFHCLSSDSHCSAGHLQGSEVVAGAGRQCVSSWLHRCFREISHCLSMQA